MSRFLFKTYPDDAKDASKIRKSRYRNGGTSEFKGGKLNFWDVDWDKFSPNTDDTFITLRLEHVKQPTLIAYETLGDTKFLWVILMYNRVVDPRDLKVGDVLRVPSEARMYTKILTD